MEVDYSQLVKQIQPQDFIKFGLIPEFVGRLPITVGLAPLDQNALVKILTAPKNALVKQYQHLLSLDKVDLVVDDDALVAIAEKSIALKTGARGLRSVMENLMLDCMYLAPNTKEPQIAHLTRAVVEGKEPLTLQLKQAS